MRTKTSSLLVALALCLASASAVPITELIANEDAKLNAKIETWEKQCGDKSRYDATCSQRRYELSGDLGKFIALVNDEVALLRDSAVDDADFSARLLQMERLIDTAVTRARSLGRKR